jgi:uncharacterized protein YdcH (DUF465 family)
MNDRPDAIYVKFPEYRERIEKYIAENEEFESLCTDYDQCVTMLKTLEKDSQIHADLEEYIEIKLELEHEILKYLF